MNFEPKNSRELKQSYLPISLVKDKRIANVESYVYIISKKFRPFTDSKEELNLVKIGTSKERGLSRISSHKTSLIELKVHRIYLYDKSDFDETTRAFTAEQKFHRAVQVEFTRMKFRGHSSQASLDRNTEWFIVPPDQMNVFLKFTDRLAFYDISPAAIHGTSFTATRSSAIPVDTSIKKNPVMKSLRAYTDSNKLKSK
jgi:hypothetical protein